MQKRYFILILLVISNFNCASFIHNSLDNNPCWKSFEIRKEARHAKTKQEQEQLNAEANAYDQLCRESNKSENAAPPPKYR